MNSIKIMVNNISDPREYYIDSYLFESSALIENICKKDDGILLQLNKTIFHPQGGGQPSDEGEIIIRGKSYPVLQLICEKDSDVIWHKIKSNDEEFEKNVEIQMKINDEKRKLYARLHSAGHLIDVAISNIGYPLTPVKGYHFPDGPYVEYNGQVSNNDAKDQIEKTCNELIDKCDNNFHVQTGLYTYEEALKTFKEVPNYIPRNKPTRFLRLVPSDIGKPCGGTHVKHIKEIGKLIISKIAKKGKNIRISYLIK